MTTNRNELERTVARLHEQLREAGPIDPEIGESLKGALKEIQQLLDKSEDSEEPATIQRSLSLSVEHFEESHPTLAATVGSIIDALGQMGI